MKSGKNSAWVCVCVGLEENWVDGLIFRGERLGVRDDECRFGYFKSESFKRC